MNIVGEMRWYLGDDYALLKFSESRGAFSIDSIIVPASHRNEGIGTMLIKRILLLADAEGKEVMVSARPIGPSSEEILQRLIKYYEHFGFEMYDRGLTIAYMRRGAVTRGTTP